MQLQFNAALQYQRDAINAVLGVFDGLPNARSGFGLRSAADEIGMHEFGIGNRLLLDEAEVLANVQKVQQAAGIAPVTQLRGMNFSVEMETGTGKTYVYLRTIFELAKRYDLKKFIIVVPGVAIREGVEASIRMMREHFRRLYGGEPFECFVYDSKKLELVRQFAVGNQIQVMIINIQSFQRDVVGDASGDAPARRHLNVIHREHEQMSGYKPIEFIAATNPVVIIDEPQSVDNTKNAKRAIGSLNPLATLRYSATHRDAYNLLYRLDPVQAYDMRLVKHIEVASVLREDDHNTAFVKLVATDNKRGVRARVEFHHEQNGAVKPKQAWIKRTDDLYFLSGRRQLYGDGYTVEEIDSKPGFELVRFANGVRLSLGEAAGAIGDDIMREQVRVTVAEHLKKEAMLKDRDIKVLSLFFIDKVANYRAYRADGTPVLGKIGVWFEEAYKELRAQYPNQKLSAFAIEQLHDGYFAADKDGRAKDTRGTTRADNDAYNLIMRDKERLLDPNEPLRFIFSHSALREGWDNPNVFQICTLNESASVLKKRQEIGRGLRLPVNARGERVHDEQINRLTVVANEHYESFARTLQTELEQDCDVQFGNRIRNARAKREVHFHKEVFLDDDFRQLWNRIKHRTRYRVRFDSADLIKRAVENIRDCDEIARIAAPRIAVSIAGVNMDKSGVHADVHRDHHTAVAVRHELPDIVTHLLRETNLTRRTLTTILLECDRLDKFMQNPQKFMTLATREVKRALYAALWDGVQYERVAGRHWPADRFAEDAAAGITRYLTNLYEVKNRRKSLYDAVAYDSDVEMRFARELDNHENVRLFVKLPAWFTVDTPAGAYNPDWAFVTEREEKLYLVRETKGSLEAEDLRESEAAKIHFGKMHFDVLGVNFAVATKLADVDF